ncbi:MAG: hypothetical protein U0787_12385 [Polyangia bacterium]
MKTRTADLLAVALMSVGLGAGCSDSSDACEGRTETCLSLTLDGADGVASADQLKVLIWRKDQPLSPTTPLGARQDFPFKVALLWPDGPASVSVRSLLGGQVNGVSAEIALDLRNGQHAQRKLTLFPPLPVTPPLDMAKPRDLSMVPDMAMPLPDLAMPLPDLAMPPPDQSMVPDL